MIISQKKYNEAIKQARAEALQTYIDYKTRRIQDTIAEAIDQIRKTEERIGKKIDGTRYKTNIFREVEYDIVTMRVEKIVRKEDIDQFPNVVDLYRKQAQSELAGKVSGMCDVFMEEDKKINGYRITAEVRVAKRT